VDLNGSPCLGVLPEGDATRRRIDIATPELAVLDSGEEALGIRLATERP